MGVALGQEAEEAWVGLSFDEDSRFALPGRPNVPEPQHPDRSTTRNVDVGKPPYQWQHITGDWFGARPWLDDRGITFHSDFTLDGAKNLMGGVDTASDAWRSLLNVNLTLDLDRLVHLKGATLFVNFQNQAGRDGSELTGDVQGISSIDADGRTQIAELWYEQRFFDDKLRIKVGKVDASSEFNLCEHSSDFVGASYTQSPNLLEFPSYPDPATSLNLFLLPTKHLYAGLGLYDGATQKGTNTGSYGPAKFFGAGLFLIAEGGVLWEVGEKLNGRAGVGVWHHTSDFEKLSGGTQSGATGFYLVADQRLWRPGPSSEDNARGISIFARYAWAPSDVSEIEHHLASGLAWVGPFASRADDVLGLGVTTAIFSTDAGLDDDYELGIELFYKIRLLHYLVLQPDLQYIRNPGGMKLQDDALAASIRLVIDF